jgi:hypothetical protein
MGYGTPLIPTPTLPLKGREKYPFATVSSEKMGVKDEDHLIAMIRS